MLELENISFSADSDGGEKEIIKNISLKIDESFVVITGPNGGGKSTLAKIIAGIVTPTSGRILLDGEDITGLSVTERARRGVSFAFQQPVHFKGLTVYDLIGLAAGKPIGINEACEYLSQVGLCARDYINREVNSSLSGGELKRIEIATVLARSTKLTIFDEPEAGIDLWSFSMLIKRFEEIHREKKECLILISHQEKIINMADKIMVIEDGEVKKYGTKEDVFPTLFQQEKCQKCLNEGGKC